MGYAKWLVGHKQINRIFSYLVKKNHWLQYKFMALSSKIITIQSYIKACLQNFDILVQNCKVRMVAGKALFDRNTNN